MEIQLKTSKIISVLLSAIIIRAFIEIFLSSVLGLSGYYISKSIQLFMYLMIVAALLPNFIKYYYNGLSGSLSPRQLFLLVLGATYILDAFTFGSLSVLAMLAAHININDTYRYFDFHSVRYYTYGFLSYQVLAFLIISVLAAPVVEEILFRGMLLINLVERYGKTTGIIITSIIFMFLHFKSSDLLGTFIFAVILSILYLRYHSILLCILIHSLSNFSLFIYQDYIGGWWIRSPKSLLDISTWIPYLFIFASSIIAMIFFYKIGILKLQDRSLDP